MVGEAPPTELAPPIDRPSGVRARCSKCRIEVLEIPKDILAEHVRDWNAYCRTQGWLVEEHEYGWSTAHICPKCQRENS